MYSCLTLNTSKFFYHPFKRHIVFALILLLFSDCCSGILEIREMLIPHLVENGTQDSVVLDCIYSLDEIDDRNLVVKWFLNDDPEPIYQWIAELGTRHASGRLQGRINLDYTVNSVDPLIKYRALNLLRPTIDLSGRYSCHVQSLQSQDSHEETMIVYATPKNIEFDYKPVTRKEYSAALRKHKSKHIVQDNTYSYPGDEQHYSSSSSELFCKVNDVYPLPELTIYRIDPDGSSPRTLDITRNGVKISSTGAYNASVSVFINDRELIEKYGTEPSIFECLVVLNEINHESRKRILYHPVDEEISSISTESKVNLLLTILSAMISAMKLNMDELN